MKECPRCHAMLFDDIEVCYGCLFQFSENNGGRYPKTCSPEGGSDALAVAHCCGHLDPDSIPLIESMDESESEFLEENLPSVDLSTAVGHEAASASETADEDPPYGHDIDDEAFDLEVGVARGPAWADEDEPIPIQSSQADETQHHLSVGVQDDAIWIEGLDVVTAQGVPAPVRVWVEWL
jgi:hypothetical protein